MKLNPTAIPHGTRTYLFEEAANKRFLEQTIHSHLRSRGFQEIVTPPFEYHESATIGLREEERNRLIRFTEGDSGRIIALRADITSQVARSAATHLLSRPLPLRLCYTGSVFRRARKGKGEKFVISQSGMEIIGHAGEDADVEIVRSIVSALDKVGLSGFSLSLGHAGFIGAILEGCDESDCEKIRAALIKKDKGMLAKILADAPAQKKSKIISLADLFGDGEEVFKKAGAIADSDNSRSALENLEKIYNALRGAGLREKISIDLGEMRGFGYYTGVNMELFSPSGIPLGTGGRYDNLVKRFGPDIPAVGFGFDIDGMIEALAKDISAPAWHGSDVVLVGGSKENADKLRSAGLMVIVPLGETDLDEVKSFAKKMDIPHILLGGSKEGSFSWIKSASGSTENCGLDDFIKKYFSK